MAKKFKIEAENKKLKVSHFEESMLAHETVKKGEKKKWQEDFKQRKDEWVKGLRQDPALEEAIFIMNDLISLTHGDKLSSYVKR